MPEYWIDSDVFIQAKNGLYGFDVAPEFWADLDRMNSMGIVASSTVVRNELMDGNDELAKWAKERGATAMFVEPDEDTQTVFQRVAQYVHDTYPEYHAAKFLDVADPWLIAHAMAGGGKVVTQETRAIANSTKAKIPDVCDFFGVETMDMYQMLRELGVSIG